MATLESNMSLLDKRALGILDVNTVVPVLAEAGVRGEHDRGLMPSVRLVVNRIVWINDHVETKRIRWSHSG